MRLHQLFSEETEEKHTCPIKYKKPDDQSWYRRNKSRCKACAKEYASQGEEDIVVGYKQKPPREIKRSKESPLAHLAATSPRAHHKPGKFGTGRVKPLSKDDSLPMVLLKSLRDASLKVDPVTGKGKVLSRNRDVCSYGHTCHSGPGGQPAANFPLPDPVATSKTGKKRFNTMFRYDPTSTYVWPVSGISGYEPKEEYADYVMSKMNCAVCRGRKKGCKNPVTHEYGAPKPYCKEHIYEMPYAKELFAKYGGPGLPNLPSHKASIKNWEAAKAEHIRKGDRIKSLKNDKGTVVDIDPDMIDNRTHKIKWDHPKTKAWEYTWEDPRKLDLIS